MHSDGKDHFNEMETLVLIGACGQWSTTEDGARVILEKTWRHSCTLVNEDRVSHEPMDLDCTLIEKNDRLPVTTLACKLGEPDFLFHLLRIGSGQRNQRPDYRAAAINRRHPIEYYPSNDGEHYQLISRGWKGEADFPQGLVLLAEPELTHCWEDDMILQDRELIRRPAGKQRGCTLSLLERFVTIPRHHERAQSEITARD